MGNKIVAARLLAEKTMLFEVEAPHIAERGQAGQFIILRVVDNGERIPLTIAHRDPARGTITIGAQEVGHTTHLLNALQPGDEILDLAGPLGKPTDIPQGGKTVCCVGGGIGNAVVWPQVQALKEAGNRVIAILGARTKDLLILEQEVAAYCDRVVVTTDDGTYGRKGLVTDALKELIDSGAEKIDEVITIGPVIMMKFVCKTTLPYGIPTQASLNPIMVDGTGMCGACRVTVDGKTRFACVEGPEFDGHQGDFDELITRLAYYREEEAIARGRDHACRLDQQNAGATAPNRQ